MKSVLVLLILVGWQIGWSAFERMPQGGKAISMGGASVALWQNPWAAFSNPGALVSVGDRTVSLFYSPQPFGLKELASGSFSFLEPMQIGTFALSGTRFGFELYREVTLTASYSRMFEEIFACGVNVNYYSLSIQNYGSASAIGIDVGLLITISDELQWGCAASNLNAPRIGAAKEKLPQGFSTGVCYRPTPNATLVADIFKDIRYETELHIGIEYSVLDLVDIRGGTAGGPSTLTAGVGIHYSLLELDYAFTNHPDLGMTHQASLSIRLGGL